MDGQRHLYAADAAYQDLLYGRAEDIQGTVGKIRDHLREAEKAGLTPVLWDRSDGEAKSITDVNKAILDAERSARQTGR